MAACTGRSPVPRRKASMEFAPDGGLRQACLQRLHADAAIRWLCARRRTLLCPGQGENSPVQGDAARRNAQGQQGAGIACQLAQPEQANALSRL